jgi:hypothetical protein
MKPKSQGKRVCGYNTYSKARASGNWDCIGEISGAPVPPWKAYLYVNIAIANTQPSSSSLSLVAPLSMHFSRKKKNSSLSTLKKFQ